MNIYENPARSEWEAICRRPSDSNPVVRERVTAIIDRVRADGDKALRELAEEIDGRCPESIRVSDKAVREACRMVSPDVKEAIKAAMENIRKFHKKQLPKEIKVKTAPGVTCIQRPVPIGRVGLYIPGGTAPLFSTVLMLAVPAKLAGCGEVVLCTPSGKTERSPPRSCMPPSAAASGKYMKSAEPRLSQQWLSVPKVLIELIKYSVLAISMLLLQSRFLAEASWR